MTIGPVVPRAAVATTIALCSMLAAGSAAGAAGPVTVQPLGRQLPATSAVAATVSGASSAVVATASGATSAVVATASGATSAVGLPPLAPPPALAAPPSLPVVRTPPPVASPTPLADPANTPAPSLPAVPVASSALSGAQKRAPAPSAAGAAAARGPQLVAPPAASASPAQSGPYRRLRRAVRSAAAPRAISAAGRPSRSAAANVHGARRSAPGAKPARRGAFSPAAGGGRTRSAPARSSGGDALRGITAALINPLKLLPVPDWSRPIILILLLVALGAGVRARWNARVANRLRRRSQDLWHDLQSLQAALVPELGAAIGPLAVSAAYCPADGPAAGGDFYDVFTRRDGQVAIVLGDVSGHGREAVTRAAHMRYTLRAYLEAGLSARDALALAGETILERGGEKFTTVAVGIYDPASTTLSYATAGHAPPLLIGTPDIALVTNCSSPPIGLGMRTGRRQTTVSLPAGSAACFFSDGLTEARTGDGMLGRERLASMLESQASERAATTLLDEVRERALDSRDDMAVCLVAPQSGLGPDVYCEVIELDAAQLASPRVDQFLKACGVSPEASFQAVAEAHAIAAVRGSAVLHVDRAREPVQIAVAWPHSPALALDRGAGRSPELAGAWPAGLPGHDDAVTASAPTIGEAQLALVPPA